MERLNNQSAFDKVLTHLRKQGRSAAGEDGCLYRAPDGAMCAVGCLIPDEMYWADMESNLIEFVMQDCPELAAYFDGVSAELLFSLQEAHDQVLAVQDLWAWDRRMQRIAAKYGLIYTPPAGE